MKTILALLVTVTVCASAQPEDFPGIHSDLIITLIQDEGPEAVIEFIGDFEPMERIELYNITRELYVFSQFEGQNLDDLIAVMDYAIEDILGAAREEDASLVRKALLDQANIFSYNLSADLA